MAVQRRCLRPTRALWGRHSGPAAPAPGPGMWSCHVDGSVTANRGPWGALHLGPVFETPLGCAAVVPSLRPVGPSWVLLFGHDPLLSFRSTCQGTAA